MSGRETGWDKTQVEFKLFALSLTLGWHVPLAAPGQFLRQAGAGGETGQAECPLGERLRCGSWRADVGQVREASQA